MRQAILRWTAAGVLTAAAMVVSADGVVTQRLTSPVNLGFEDGSGGDRSGAGPGFAAGAPAGWYEGTEPLGFEVGTDDDRAYEGLRSATVSRVPGRAEGEATGSLLQRIDAGPGRGKTVRIRAAVRVETSGSEGAAHLVLRALGEGLSASGSERPERVEPPIREPQWRLYELTLDVPEDAEAIEYGLALTGAGQAWFDAVELEEAVADLPPTCLPPTVPNCGLVYNCPASAHCCSRWEATEYCCQTPPINGALIDDGGQGDCRTTAEP